MPLSEAMQAQMLATGGNVGIGAGNFLSQLFFNRSNRRFAQQQYRQQVSDTLAQWNRENVYNNPAAQMARFKSAGLNPNLVYGMQNLSAPTSTMGSPNNPNTSAPQVGDVGFTQIPQTMLQSQLLNAQIDNINADTAKKQEETTTISTLRPYQVMDMAGNYVKNKAQAADLISHLQVNENYANLLASQTEAQNIENLFNQNANPERLRALAAQADCLETEAKYAEALYIQDLALKRAQTAAAYGQAEQSRAQADLARAQKLVAESQRLLTDEQRYVIEDTHDFVVQSANYDAQIKGKQVNIEQQVLEMAEFDNEHKKGDRGWRIFGTVFGAASNVGSAATGVARAAAYVR